MKKIFVFLIFAIHNSFSQSITIDPSGGNNGNIHINSTDGGLVIPKMTSAQRSAISNPVQGLMVFQTDGSTGFWVNKSSLRSIPNWSRITEGENLWMRNVANNNNISPISTGNIGIGTAIPTDKLTVQTPTNNYGLTHSDGTHSISTYVGGNAGWLGTKTLTPLYFYTNGGGSQMTLSTTGYLGIGNINPVSPLSFSEAATSKISFNGGEDKGIGISSFGNVNLYSNNSFMFGVGSNSSFNKGVEVDGSGFIGVNLGSLSPSGRIDMGSTDGNNLVLRNLGTLVGSNTNSMFFKNGNYWTGRISAIGTSTTEAKLSFFTGANSSPHSLLEKMTISNDGDVGIGNSTPAAKLDVNGNVKIANGLDVTGNVKIANGTQGFDKVLTSDANGNASWQTKVSSFENSERFYLTREHSTLSNIVTYDVVYNLSNNIGITNGVVTINMAGLYQFDYTITCTGPNDKIVGNTDTSVYGLPNNMNTNAYNFYFKVDRPTGSDILIPMNVPMYLNAAIGFAGGAYYQGFGQKSNSVKLYLPVGSIISILSSSLQSPTTFSFGLSGNLVSD